MANAILLQGKFTADGAAKVLQLRSNIDWMRVYNWTQMAAQQSTGRGVEYYWQRGMAQDSGIIWKKKDSGLDDLKGQVITSGGFTLIDTTTNPLATKMTDISAISTATVPVVTVGDTTALSNGDVIRFEDVTGAQQLGGLDFTIGSLATYTFTLPYMSTLGGAGTSGSYRRVIYDPLFYPRQRYITAITKATNCVVTMSVTHNMSVGQVVRLIVPAAYGMIEANKLQGKITAINTTTNTITLDIDTTTFTTFEFPTTTYGAFSPALVVPMAEDGTYPNLQDDSTRNTGYIGMRLAAGVVSPAGSTGSPNDVIYWVAGKSYSVTNE